MFWIRYVQCNQRKQKEAKPFIVMLLFQSFNIVFTAIVNYWTKVTQSLRLVITNKFVLHCKWPGPIKSYFKLKIKGQHQILKFYSINAAEYFELETIKFGKRPQILPHTWFSRKSNNFKKIVNWSIQMWHSLLAS